MTTLKQFKKPQSIKSKRKVIPMAEEEQRRLFFNKVRHNDDDTLKAELYDFADKGNADRKQFIDQLNKMDPDLVKKYMNAYLAQKKLNSVAFLDLILKNYKQGYDPHKEEELRRDFFQRVVTIDNTHDFIEQLTLFAMSDDASQQRADLIDKITTTMNRRLAQKYMTEFLSQRGLTSSAYLRDFLKREEIKIDKFYEKNPEILEEVEEYTQNEPTTFEMYEDIDYEPDFDDEGFGGGINEYDIGEKRVPSWWVKDENKVWKVIDTPEPAKKKFWKLYTRQGCGWCKKAKELLDDRREEYISIEITPEKLEELRPKIGDYNTVPIVFLNDEFIGGYTELERIVNESSPKKRIAIFESFEGPIESPTAWGPEIIRKPLPVQRTPGLDFDPSCYNIQISLPWIKGKVKNVWLQAPEGESINMDYVNKHEKIDNIEGKPMYKAGRSFYQLQCNYNSNRRHQNGYVLTSYDRNNKPVRFVVLYEMDTNREDDKWVYQDEAIFQAQIEYYRNRVVNTISQLGKIRSEIVSEDIRRYAQRHLQSELSGYISDPNYIAKIEESIFSKHKDVDKYLNAISGIVVFMRDWNKSVFKERVRSLYYQPEVLADLSLEEKLPEVFENTNITDLQQQHTEQQINEMIRQDTDNILRVIIRTRFPGRAPTRPTFAIPVQLPVRTNMTPICVDDMKRLGIPDVNIIYYTDIDKKTYCFDVFELKNEFENGNFINQYTGNKFSDEFISKVFRFDPYTVSISETNDDEKPLSLTKIPMTILAPDFLQKVIDDIERMENNMVNDAKDKILEAEISGKSYDTSEICEYCHKYVNNGKGYKTIIRRDNEYELVRFCNTKCFEGVEEWEEGREPSRPPMLQSQDQDIGEKDQDIGEEVVTVQITKRNKPEPGQTEGQEYTITQFKKRKDVLPGEVIIERNVNNNDNTKMSLKQLFGNDEEAETLPDTLSDIPEDKVSIDDIKTENDIFEDIFTEAKSTYSDNTKSSGSTSTTTYKK